MVRVDRGNRFTCDNRFHCLTDPDPVHNDWIARSQVPGCDFVLRLDIRGQCDWGAPVLDLLAGLQRHQRHDHIVIRVDLQDSRRDGFRFHTALESFVFLFRILK